MDMRPENILIKNPEQENLKFKLCDFGMSENAVSKSEKRRTTLNALYRMPEIFIGSDYSYKADIWCLGITISETILGFNQIFAKKTTNPDIETIDKQIVSVASLFLYDFISKYIRVLTCEMGKFTKFRMLTEYRI